MLRCEATMVVRDTAGMIVPLLLPLLILLTSASPATAVVVHNGRTAFDIFVLPVVFVTVTAMTGMINMPSFLAYYRRSGILRRLSATPASPAMVLTAQGMVSMAQTLLGTALALGSAVLLFGASLPARPLAALGVFALAAAALYAAGGVVASLAPTPNSATAIGLVGFLGLGAAGGMFGGTAGLPEPIAALGAALPFGAAVQALSAAWAGTAVEPAWIISLVLAALIGAGLSALLFRWQ